MKLIKIPFSGGGLGKGNGANQAPDEIVKYLENFHIEEVQVDEFNISESHNNIFKHIKDLKEKAILLGGDHSISYPTIKGFAQNNKDFKLIIFDAHPDLVNNFVPPTQEDYLRVLVEEKIVQPENILLIGIRNSDKIETDYIQDKGIKTIWMKDVDEDTLNIITNFCNKQTYISLDIDAIDPTEAPGTGYFEPNGFTSEYLIRILRELKETNNLKMIDIVEVNPSKDVGNKTSILAAKIIENLREF